MMCDIFLTPSLLQAIEGVGVATVVTSMVTRITTTATRTTTDGPANRQAPGEGKWEGALGALLGATRTEKLRRKHELGARWEI